MKLEAHKIGDEWYYKVVDVCKELEKLGVEIDPKAKSLYYMNTKGD